MICSSELFAASTDSVAVRIYIVRKTVLATKEFKGKTLFETLRKGIIILGIKWSCSRFCGAKFWLNLSYRHCTVKGKVVPIHAMKGV